MSCLSGISGESGLSSMNGTSSGSGMSGVAGLSSTIGVSTRDAWCFYAYRWRRGLIHLNPNSHGLSFCLKTTGGGPPRPPPPAIMWSDYRGLIAFGRKFFFQFLSENRIVFGRYRLKTIQENKKLFIFSTKNEVHIFIFDQKLFALNIAISWIRWAMIKKTDYLTLYCLAHEDTHKFDQTRF